MYLVQAISNLKKGYINIDPNSRKNKGNELYQRVYKSKNKMVFKSKANFKNNPLFFMFLIVSF